MAEKIDFKKILEALQSGVFRCTTAKKSRFLYCNSFFQEMFGIKSGNCAKMHVHNIFVDAKRYQTFCSTIKEIGFVRNFEARLKNCDKRTVWCSLSAKWIKNCKTQYIDVVVHNISVRKRFEKEILESKKLFQTVFNNSAAAITVTDKHEKIMAWNPFAEKMLGMSKKDLFNKPVKDLYPPKEWRRMRSFRIRKKGMLSDIETQVYTREGGLLDVNLSVSVLKNVEGKVIGSIGIMRDITTQKVAERQIKESENKIRILVDNSAASIISTDAQERIISWNKFTEHLLGMKKKDLYLLPVKSLYPEEEWKKIRAENIRKKGSKHHLETKVIKKDGTIIDVDISINILKDSENKIMGAVGIMMDITEQKRFKEMLVQAKIDAEEANSAKSLFLANMSHEVRTPMNAIMGMLDLTLDTQMTEEQRDNLVVAKEASDNLLSLINDILDLSKVEAGKISLETIEIDLHNVVRNLCKGLSVIASKKQVELILDIHPKVPELVKGDPVRLRQILINLINNAVKFTNKGKVTIRIQLDSQLEEECELLFSVIDEGIGIPKNKQALVFEAFMQAEDSTTRKYGGTGLGLAISKRLVEMMGGKIWVESQEGKGSNFSFTALFKNADPAMKDIKNVHSHEENGDFSLSEDDIRNTKILLAEDNIVNQKIAMRILEKQGFSVDVVDNGQAAIDNIFSKNYDLVLMDAFMPKLDGLEATKIIRQKEKETGAHIPIIALTARAMDDDKKKCLESGMDGYVAKPIDRKKLFDEIVKMLNKGKIHERKSA